MNVISFAETWSALSRVVCLLRASFSSEFSFLRSSRLLDSTDFLGTSAVSAAGAPSCFCGGSYLAIISASDISAVFAAAHFVFAELVLRLLAFSTCFTSLYLLSKTLFTYLCVTYFS